MTINLTTPVGRIVQGDLSKPQPVLDNAGKQKVGRDGQPMIQHYFALAIPKTPGHTHWAQTDWGKQIWDEGNRAHPNFAPHPTFSWKIEDGDSAVPNKKGKLNRDREGFPGHWVLKFRSGFLPKTYNADGSAPVPADSLKCGYYAQVNCSVAGNTGDSPGVYLNPNMVALSGYGPEIIAGPDAAEAGFGAAPLPPGASATPVGGFAPTTPGFPPGVAPIVTGVPTGAPVSAGVAPSGPFAAPYATPFSPPPSTPLAMATAGPATTSPSNPPVNPAFLAPPPPPASISMPPPPRALTPKAAGASYADLIKAGWTDALLVQHGMMQP